METQTAVASGEDRKNLPESASEGIRRAQLLLRTAGTPTLGTDVAFSRETLGAIVAHLEGALRELERDVAYDDHSIGGAAIQNAEAQGRAAIERILSEPTIGSVANYRVEYDGPEGLVLRDLGPWERHLTVTNDAEGVVARVRELLGDRRLFYIDSDGQLDELLVKDGQFAGFAAGAPAAIRERVS